MLAIVGIVYRPALTPDLKATASFASPKTTGAAASSAARAAPPAAPVGVSGNPSVNAAAQPAAAGSAPAGSLASSDPPPPVPPSNLPAWGSNVTWDSTSGRVSGNGLIAGYCCAGAYSTVLANKAVTTGLHYWELTLDGHGAARSPRTFTTAGVTTAAGGVTALRATGPGDSATAIPFGHASRYRNGDTFMFALDGARTVLYIGLNGAWLNGDPAAATGGTKVDAQPGQALRPYASVAAPGSSTGQEDRWLANFGGAPFKYSVPGGYSAYGSSSARASAATVATSPGSQPQTAPAAGAPEASASLMGREVRDQLSLGGVRIPLPDGNWTVVAFFRSSSSADGDRAVLASIAQNRLRGVIAARGGPVTGGQSPAPFTGCVRQDYVHRQMKTDDGSGLERCWWINHATGVWQADPLMRAASAELLKRGITPPTVMLNVGFRRATTDAHATAFYYFDPMDDGISSQPLLWQSSEWHRDRIASDPRRVDYVEKLKLWGANWAPIFFATH